MMIMRVMMKVNSIKLYRIEESSTETIIKGKLIKEKDNTQKREKKEKEKKARKK